MYKLSRQLIGHTNDVKSLTVIDANTIVSSSRDGSIRKWTISGTLVDQLTIFNSSAGSYINATVYLQNDLIASGGKDCIIFINNITDENTDVGTVSNLIGHQNNICWLSVTGNLLVSSSWDGTAKIWDIETFKLLRTLDVGNSVLHSVFLSDNKLLTALSDRLIRLWHGDKVITTFSGHTDVVRKIVVLSDTTFASCSNDGTIKIWHISQNTPQHELLGHESFIYDLIQLPNGSLVSASEDRTIRIWKDFKISQSITLPCISNWCLAHIANDIVIGSSDNMIRIFTSDSKKFASAQELIDFEQQVSNSTISEQTVDLNKTEVPGVERLNQPGSEGQTIMVKSPAGIIEAYNWSNNKWNKIGEVVSALSSGSKKVYKGKEYDYVFDVDVEDGKPPLKLPFNSSDNVYTAAERFLAENNLPTSYLQEVVNFIQKNTEGQQITQTTNSATNDETPSRFLSILPVKEPLLFEDVNTNQLVKGLTKFNQANGNQISDIPEFANLGSADSVRIINTVVKTIFTWDEPSLVIGFDILRVLISNISISDFLQNAELPELLLTFIKKGTSSCDVTVNLMMLKFLSNFTPSVGFVQIYLDQDGSNVVFNEFLTQLLQSFHLKNIDLSHKHGNQYLVNLATFIFNLSVLQVKRNINNTDLTLFFNNGLLSTNNEALYRLLISYGNLKTIMTLPKWEFNVPNESRFDELVKEINSL